jgi:O-antigen/teichoic acid export membrane protein
MSRTGINSLWNAINAGGQTLAAFALSVLLVRSAYPPDQLELYFFGVWISAVGAGLACGGWGSAATQFGAEFVGAGEPGFAATFAARMRRTQFITGLALCTTAAAALHLLRIPASGAELAALAALLLARLVNNAQASDAAAFGAFRTSAHAALIAAITSSAFTAIAAIARCPAWILILAQAAGLAVGAIWMERHHPLRHIHPKSPLPVDPRRRRFIWITLGISIVAAAAWQRVEVPFLRRWGTEGSVTAFTILAGLAASAMRLPQAMIQVLASRYAALEGSRDADRLQWLHQLCLRCVAVAFIPCVLLPALAGGPLLKLAYGATMAPHALPFALCLLGQFFLTAAGVPRSLLYASGREWGILATDLSVVALNFALLPPLIRAHSLHGAALGNAAAMGLLFIASLALSAARCAPGLGGWWLARLALAAACAMAPGLVGLCLHASHWAIVIGLLAAGLLVFSRLIGPLRLLTLDELLRVVPASFHPFARAAAHRLRLA